MEKEKLTSLVEKAQTGDPEAVQELFTACYDEVYYFALKTVKDPDLACDITQESFLEVINTLQNLQHPEAFKAWLRQITYHQCTRHFRQTKEVQVEEDEDGNSIFDTLTDESEGAVPAEVYEKEEFRQTILQMVDSLSAEQRAAVMLYYFDELSVEEVARVQGVSTGTVKSRLNYARKALKKSVEDYEKKNNIKLHSLAPLPLLLLVLRATAQKMPAGAAAAAKSAIGSASAIGVTGKAGTVAKAVLAAKKAIAIKVAAGVAAAALVTTGAVAALNGRSSEEKEDNRVKPGTYASETMVIYGQTDALAEQGIEVLGPHADYFVSKDGVCYELSFEDEPKEVGRGHEVLYLAGDVGYQDGDTFTAPDGSKLTGIRGQVQAVIRPIGPKTYGLSVDEDGAYGSCVDLDTGEMLCRNLPLKVHGLENQQIRDIEVIPGILSAACVITDNGFAYGTLDSIHYTVDAVELYLSVMQFVEGRVMDYSYAVSSRLPAYISYDDGQLYINEKAVQMPDGYDTSQLVQVLGGQLTVLRFADGSVYTAVNGTFQRHQQLSAYGQAGHLKQVFLSNYYASGNILVLMDDHVIYQVTGDTEG